jgi:hypothetical protein
MVTSVTLAPAVELNGYDECKKVLVEGSINFNSQTFNNFESKITGILNSDKFTRADGAQVMLSALEPDDFNFVYYKLRAFMIFDLIILEEILPNDYLRRFIRIKKNNKTKKAKLPLRNFAF